MTSLTRRTLTLAVFILAVLGGGILIGLIAQPGTWYPGLHKQPFNPPNWIFGPAWSIL
jgi:tryptophan-rich sensory protein